MLIQVFALAGRMPSWVEEGTNDYLKRMPSDCRVQMVDLKPEPRTSGRTVEQLMAAEARRLEAALPAHAWTVVLDERGEDCTSVRLAQHLMQWRERGDPIALVIGGADGLDATFKARAQQRLRLSSLTLPHPLVRIVLAEALYRAWTITQQHPYHRA